MIFFDAILARFRWFRRLRGGHWERWYCPDMSQHWIQREHGPRDMNSFLRGRPTCEEWS